jgi:hypothetical protein
LEAIYVTPIVVSFAHIIKIGSTPLAPMLPALGDISNQGRIMTNILINPLFYILLVNIFGLFWAIRSWRKTIQEKWMNNLRDAGAEIIGASELVHATAARAPDPSATAKAEFIAKEQKLLLLFAHNGGEKKHFQTLAESLRRAAETHSDSYRSELEQFSGAVSDRVLKEWREVNSWL